MSLRIISVYLLFRQTGNWLYLFSALEQSPSTPGLPMPPLGESQEWVAPSKLVHFSTPLNTFSTLHYDRGVAESFVPVNAITGAT